MNFRASLLIYLHLGLRGKLSEQYVGSALSIEDVTALAHRLGEAHASARCNEAMTELVPELPQERQYIPRCKDGVLYNLGMLNID